MPYKFNPFTNKLDIALDYGLGDTRYLKLDQTTPQSVIGGKPYFTIGLTIDSGLGSGFTVDIDDEYIQIACPSGQDAVLRWNNDGSGSVAGGIDGTTGDWVLAMQSTLDPTKGISVDKDNFRLLSGVLTNGRVPYYSDGFIDSANLTFSGTILTALNATITTALKNTALTSGRVPYLTTSGQFTDSANLTYDGTDFVWSGTSSEATARSVTADGGSSNVGDGVLTIKGASTASYSRNINLMKLIDTATTAGNPHVILQNHTTGGAINSQGLFGLRNHNSFFQHESTNSGRFDIEQWGGSLGYLSTGYIKVGTAARPTDRIETSNGNIVILSDSYYFYCGGGKDMAIRYDGTNGSINTSVVAASDLDITCGANKTIELQNPVYDDLQFAISSGRVSAAKYPNWETFTTNTAEYAFDVNDYIDLGANELPHWWKQGTDGDVHVHFSIKTDQSRCGSEYVQITVYIAYVDTGEVWQETNLTQEKEIPESTDALTQFYLDLGNLTLTNYLIGGEIKIRVERIAATGGTEYADSIYIHQVGVHLQKDTMGSRQETVK